MNLKDLAVDVKTVWVPFEGVKGFEVELSYIPRTEMTKILRDCQISKMSRQTRQIEKTLDEDKFLKKFVDRAIKGWKGLTPKKLEEFVVVEYPEESADIEIPFSKESAEFLLKESQMFDDWVNEKIGDIDSFRTRSA